MLPTTSRYYLNAFVQEYNNHHYIQPELIDDFLEHISETNADTAQLSKLIHIVLIEDLSEPILKKIHQIFAKNCMEENVSTVSNFSIGLGEFRIQKLLACEVLIQLFRKMGELYAKQLIAEEEDKLLKTVSLASDFRKVLHLFLYSIYKSMNAHPAQLVSMSKMLSREINKAWAGFFANKIVIENRRAFPLCAQNQTLFHFILTELEKHTPLTFACQYCSNETIIKIAKKCYSSRPNQMESAFVSPECYEFNELDQTPVMVACLYKNAKAAIYLSSFVKYEHKNQTNSQGWTALHFACKSGCIEAVKAFSEEDDLNVQTKSGLTPLMVACLYNQEEVVSYLLTIIGVDNSIASSEGWTAFHYACLSGSLDVVRLLLESGCLKILRIPTKSGQTPLMIACAYNHPEIAGIFLELGAEKHCADSNGWMAIHYACLFGCLEAVKQLVTPENLFIQTDSRDTPFMLAYANSPEVRDYLIEYVRVCH